MTEDVIRGLQDVLGKHICTLKKTSRDLSENEYMCNSDITVVEFDKIPHEYAKGKGWPSIPRSNDALYIAENNKWYFVEFKNGSIDKANIYRKLYDSILILLDMRIISDLEFVRSNIEYILVYNSEKYGRIQSSTGRDATYEYIYARAETEEKLFEIGNLEGYLFYKTHTYSRTMFEEKFIRPVKQAEGYHEEL